MREPPKVLKTSVIKDQKNENSLVSQNLLKEITEQLADVHLRQGKGVHSSTLHLSIKDIEGCAIKLIRTNELCYAYVLSQLFQLSCHDIIIKKMAEKAIFVNDFQLGRIFLEKMKKNLDQKSILMRNLGSRLSEMPLGIKKLEEYANLGKSMLDKFDFLGAVVNNILAKNYHTSFEIAVDYAKSNKKINFRTYIVNNRYIIC